MKKKENWRINTGKKRKHGVKRKKSDKLTEKKKERKKERKNERKKMNENRVEKTEKESEKVAWSKRALFVADDGTRRGLANPFSR